MCNIGKSLTLEKHYKISLLLLIFFFEIILQLSIFIYNLILILMSLPH